MSSYRHKSLYSISNSPENTKENEAKNNTGVSTKVRELPKSDFNVSLAKPNGKAHKVHIREESKAEKPSKKFLLDQANSTASSNLNLVGARALAKRKEQYKAIPTEKFRVYQEDPFIENNAKSTSIPEFNSSLGNHFKFPLTSKLGVKPSNQTRDIRDEYVHGKDTQKKDNFAAPVGGLSKKTIDYEKLLSLPEDVKVSTAKQIAPENGRYAPAANARQIYNNGSKKSTHLAEKLALRKEASSSVHDTKPLSKYQVRAEKPAVIKKLEERILSTEMTSESSTPKTEPSTATKSSIKRPSPSALRDASSHIKPMSELLDQATIDKVKSELARVDREEAKDPTMEVTYAADIINNWVSYEPTVLPSQNFLDNQPGITMEMRAEQINWMIGFLTGGPFNNESLHIAINIMDRVLSTNTLTETKLHCLAITSLFMALKYEEVQVPCLDVILANSLEPVTKDDVIKCEIFIVMGLSGDFNYPSPLIFLRRYSKADDYDVRARTIAKYFIDLCLFDYEVSQHRPSIIAASSLYLAQYILGRRSWTPKHIYLSNYGEKQLTPFVKVIISILAQEEIISPNLEEKFRQSDQFDTGDLCRQFIRAKKSQLNTKPTSKATN